MTKLGLAFCFMYCVVLNLADASPRISFEELLVQSELNPQNVLLARAEAMRMNLPLNIMSKDNVIADVKGIEDGKPVYAVITDFADVYNGGYTAFYEEVEVKINFANAKIDYGNKYVVDNTNGFFTPVLSGRNAASSFIMVTESTHDRVSIFNADNGDLIDTAFIPSTRPQLATPKVALKHYNSEKVIVCDQITDVVQLFNLNGTYNGFYAPNTGPNTSIVDNMRGMAYRPNNNVVVSVGSGVNQNTIHQIIGAMWFSPFLFAEKWMQLMGKSMQDFENADITPYIISIINAIILNYAMAYLFLKLNVENFMRGLYYAFIFWFAFLFVELLTFNAFELRPIGLTLIDSGKSLVTFLISGFVLGTWKKFSSETINA